MLGLRKSLKMEEQRRKMEERREEEGFVHCVEKHEDAVLETWNFEATLGKNSKEEQEVYEMASNVNSYICRDPTWGLAPLPFLFWTFIRYASDISTDFNFGINIHSIGR